jgi:predicted Rdx family selenoprotein
VKARLEARGAKAVAIQPGRAGQFDVAAEGKLVYSRYQTGRFPTDAEVDALPV